MGPYSVWLAVASVLLLLTVLQQLSSLSKNAANLCRVEAKLDLLLQNAGISYNPYKDLPAACVQALQSGNKIAAINEFRKLTGAGLKEAKDFIEDAQKRMTPDG